MGSTSLQAMVTGALTVNTRHGVVHSEYTTYRVTVRDQRCKMWCVDKRYSDFEALHSVCGSLCPMGFPGKFSRSMLDRMTRKKDPEFIKTRRAALHEYITALLKNEEAQGHPVVAAFFDPGQRTTPQATVVHQWSADLEELEVWAAEEKGDSDGTTANAPTEICFRFANSEQASSWKELLHSTAVRARGWSPQPGRR